MFDAHLRSWIDPPLNAVAAWVARYLGANSVTISGFALGVGAAIALAFQLDLLALGLIIANRIADGLDGAIARRLGPTDVGGYLDIVLDFLFYALVPFGFAIGRPEFALSALFLVVSFVGTGSSFLAFAALAAKRGMTTEARGRKSIYYLGGLAEGAETIAIFLAICIWPMYFAWFAYGFGGLCVLTTALRIVECCERLGSEGNQRASPSAGPNDDRNDQSADMF